MSENSKEHYCGVPNKDECMNLVGEIAFWIMIVIIVAVFSL